MKSSEQIKCSSERPKANQIKLSWTVNERVILRHPSVFGLKRALRFVSSGLSSVSAEMAPAGRVLAAD